MSCSSCAWVKTQTGSTPEILKRVAMLILQSRFFLRQTTNKHIPWVAQSHPFPQIKRTIEHQVAGAAFSRLHFLNWLIHKEQLVQKVTTHTRGGTSAESKLHLVFSKLAKTKTRDPAGLIQTLPRSNGLHHLSNNSWSLEPTPSQKSGAQPPPRCWRGDRLSSRKRLSENSEKD